MLIIKANISGRRAASGAVRINMAAEEKRNAVSVSRSDYCDVLTRFTWRSWQVHAGSPHPTHTHTHARCECVCSSLKDLSSASRSIFFQISISFQIVSRQLQVENHSAETALCGSALLKEMISIFHAVISEFHPVQSTCFCSCPYKDQSQTVFTDLKHKLNLCLLKLLQPCCSLPSFPAPRSHVQQQKTRIKPLTLQLVGDPLPQ